MNIQWNEDGSPCWDDGPLDLTDEPAALRAIEARLTEAEWQHWQTHALMLSEHGRANVVERTCSACRAWFEMEWANDRDFALTMSVGLVKPCLSQGAQQNIVRTYALRA